MANSFYIRLEILIQWHFAHFYPGNIGGNLIHPIRWGQDEDVVLPWFAKNPNEEIYCFIAAISQKDIGSRDIF